MLWKNGEWRYFTNDEIRRSGGDPNGMCPIFMHKLSLFRDMINVPMIIVPNGMNSGNHKAKEHPQGQAADFYFTRPVSDERVLHTAGLCKLNGIGLYTNHIGAKSYHVDDREVATMWKGIRHKEGESWTYSRL